MKTNFQMFSKSLTRNQMRTISGSGLGAGEGKGCDGAIVCSTDADCTPILECKCDGTHDRRCIPRD